MSNPWEQEEQEDTGMEVAKMDDGVHKITDAVSGTVTEAEIIDANSKTILPALCRAMNATLDRLAVVEKTIMSMAEGTLAALKRIEEGVEKSAATPAPSAPTGSYRPPQPSGGYSNRGGAPRGRMSDDQKLQKALKEKDGLPPCGADCFDESTLDQPVGFGKHKEVTWGDMRNTGDQLGYLVWLAKDAVEKAGSDPTAWGRGQSGAQVALWVLNHNTSA